MYRSVSLWLDDVAAAGDPLTPRPGLDGDVDVDVAIVGGGYTGLWTARYLADRDPSLRRLMIRSGLMSSTNDTNGPRMSNGKPEP